MAVRISASDDVWREIAAGYRAAKSGMPLEPPASYKTPALRHAWLVGWVAGTHGWDIEY